MTFTYSKVRKIAMDFDNLSDSKKYVLLPSKHDKHAISDQS